LAAVATSIPKDRINRLRDLAAEASRSEIAFDKAAKQFKTAGGNLVTAARELATQLYAIACDFADQPELIDAELNRLSLTVKPTSLVYIRICRLAFANEDTDRSRISRYASLIEQAHKKGMSKDAFADLASSGLTGALNKLFAEVLDEPVQLGRREARKLFGGEQVFDAHLGADVKNGTELQLLGRYEDGKIVLYGMVPPDLADPTLILKKIGGAKLSENRKLGDVFPQVLRTIKLIGSVNDAALVGSYVVGSSACQLVIESKGSFAELSFPKKLDFMSGTDVALPTQTWAQISETVGIVGKQPLEAAFDGTSLKFSVGGLKGEPLVDWLAKKKKPATGAVQEDAIVIPITPLQTAKTVRVGRNKGSEIYDKQKMEALLTFKPTTAYTDIQFGADEVTVRAVKGKGTTGNLVSRKSLSQLKAASRKMLGWSNGKLSGSCVGGYVVLEASNRDFTYSFSVPTA
jgi:hypothetical protein